MADIGPSFAAVARRREAKARDAEVADELVTARDNYFMAAIHLGRGAVAVRRERRDNVGCNQKKRDCYTSYARLADHHVEAAWIPFRDARCRRGFICRRITAAAASRSSSRSPGWTASRKAGVALYGDRWLNRGMAVLAIDGPGQYEAPIVGINVSMENWDAVGHWRSTGSLRARRSIPSVSA